MARGRSSLVGTVVKPLIGLAMLGVVLSQLQWSELLALLARPDRETLWLGTGCLVLSLLLMQPLRLHSVLSTQTGGLGASFRLSMIGALFNNLLPSNVGGDAVRLLYLVRARPGNVGGPLAMLLLLRLSQIGLLYVVAIVCALADLSRLIRLVGERVSLPQSSGLWAGLFIVAVAIAAVLLLRSALGRRLRTRAGAIFEQARQGLAELSLRALVELLLYTSLYHALRVFGFCLLCSYAGTLLRWPDAVLVLALTALFGLLPITVGGLGVMEGAIAAGLLAFGIPSTAAVAVALVNRGALLVPALTGGVIFALDRDRLAQAQVEKADSV